METFNLFAETDWENVNDHDGYRHKVTAFGRQLGGKLLGGSLYELPPGEKTWPYHYEQGAEEWLLVVSGRPTLRSAGGEQELEPGDSGKLGIWSQGEGYQAMLRDEPKLDYWEGE
jgi:uncharacterized cupin superfamily protein